MGDSRPPEGGVQHTMKMGLGEAIIRLVDVRISHASDFSKAPAALQQEADMITEALNQYELNLAFDCNNDGVPDTVEIFEESANTGCCRILPLGMTGSSRKRRSSRSSRGSISHKSRG